MNAYWYISDAKLDQLRQTIPRTWTQDLVLKLKFKSPWLEVEVGQRNLKAAVSNCELIEETLTRNMEVPSFESLGDADSPVFTGFNVLASRAIANDGYWIAGYAGKTALLLGGSPKHAIGAQDTPLARMTPSINPVGAASELNTAGIKKTTAENLSYAWQEVIRSGAGSISGASLPVVEGIALFAGRFPAIKAQTRRVGRGELTQLVIASPIFVRQG